MKTLFTILQIFASAIASIIMVSVYMLVFTPLYMVTMAIAGVSFVDILNKWIRISKSLTGTINEEA